MPEFVRERRDILRTLERANNGSAIFSNELDLSARFAVFLRTEQVSAGDFPDSIKERLQNAVSDV